MHALQQVRQPVGCDVEGREWGAARGQQLSAPLAALLLTRGRHPG
jgi:hypothetical protein